jgi:hypothetical protein
MSEETAYFRVASVYADGLVQLGDCEYVVSDGRILIGPEFIEAALVLKDAASVILAIRAGAQLAQVVVRAIRKVRRGDEVTIVIGHGDDRRSWTLRDGQISDQQLSEIQSALEELRPPDSDGSALEK